MFFHLKQSFVFSFLFYFLCLCETRSLLTYPGLEVVSLRESGLCGLCTQRLVGRAGSEGVQITSSFRVGGSLWLGGRWGWVWLTVARARCELGHHLGSMVVTTLWCRASMTQAWGLAPALLTWHHFPWWSCSFLQGAVPRRTEARDSGGCAWVVLAGQSQWTGFQSAVSALWLGNDQTCLCTL